MNVLSPGAGLLFLSATSAAALVGPNTDDLAKELANPGAAHATLNFKLEYRGFDGDLPGASDQNSTTLTFRPVLPFVLQSGNNLIFRPAFSYVWDQPRPNGGTSSSLNSWGDIPYDLLYSRSVDTWTRGAGVARDSPTGLSASTDNWLLGPSFLAVRTFYWGVAGIIPFHNEKVGGSEPDTSISSLQYFLFYSLGNGWQIGAGPTITHDWNAPDGDEWTAPFQLAVAKTPAISAQLEQLNFSIERSVERPDTFAEEWTATFTFSPVVTKPFQKNLPERVDKAARAALLELVRPEKSGEP